jgi:hypothetical protein
MHDFYRHCVSGIVTINDGWYYEDRGAWKLYRFDRGFGRGEHFVKGEYRVPAEGVKIELPNHGVFRVR